MCLIKNYILIEVNILKSDLIEKIHYRLKQDMSPQRYKHTQGVVDTAVYLANKYGADKDAAYMAALLHDYAKDFSKEQVKEYISRNGLTVDDIMLNVHQLLHGKIAAHIAREQFNIHDEDVLNAIEYHTTGRKKMSKLEKIIYLADFIEPGRNYAGVEELREVAEQDLNKAVLLALNNTIKYVISMEKLLHTNTIEARNTLLLEV
ncbi:MAG: HD domain-containing protein [Clostridiales bacterium]|jgi:predicted HD superfamily hydrolase involved in NAD metabolism|nr:HD domain-containing protein [Clostridiales bacterium]